MFELRVEPGSPLAGRTLAEAGLPPGVLVISVTHDGETIFPQAATRIESGDLVMLVADPAAETILRGFLEARTGRGYRGSAEGQP